MSNMAQKREHIDVAFDLAHAHYFCFERQVNRVDAGRGSR